VRQLLAAVILERTVRRERVAALLWPELGEGAASANLRVNLTHLRRLLEPDRHPGEPGFHLRVDQSTIRLHESDHLVVDVWQHIDDLDGRRFDRLAARWRGEPFADLLDVDDVQPSIEGLRSRHVTGLLSLGELAIARGSAALAADCAVQALRIDPLREQSHRLAIAAAMQQHSPADVALGLRQLDAALRELGVGASEATDVLRRRVAQQFGSLRAAHHSGGSTMTSR
jgi:DNA-binding SARP family transcriptional activator